VRIVHRSAEPLVHARGSFENEPDALRCDISSCPASRKRRNGHAEWRKRVVTPFHAVSKLRGDVVKLNDTWHRPGVKPDHGES
jgi:hypothetical protein